MASVKLVNGNPHHLHHYSLHSHHHHPHHHPPFLHHHHHHSLPLVNPPSPPPSPTTSPVAQGHSDFITATTAGMTLDYSLPNRSRQGDSDHPIELKLNKSNIIKDVITSDNSSTNSSRPHCHQNDSDDYDNVSQNTSNKRNARDAILKPSSPSSPQSPHSLITGSEHAEFRGMPERNSPTKKNKRKLSEPRKLRSDIDNGVDSPTSPHTEMNSPAPSCSDDQSEDENLPPAIKIPKFPSQSIVVSDDMDIRPTDTSIPKQQPPHAASAKHKSRKNKHSPPSNNEQFSSSSTPPPSASSTSPSSSSSPYITQSHAPQPDNDNSIAHKSSSSSALPNGLPPPSILHPFLSAVPPAAFGLIPGLYLPGQPYTSPALPTTFPGIPLHLQQNYFAAAAAAAAAQSAGSSPPPSHIPPSSSSSTSAAPQTLCSSSSPVPAPSDTLESSQLYKQRDPSSSSSSSSLTSSHPVILQPPQLHGHLSHLGCANTGGSGLGRRKSPAPSSRLPQQPSSSATSTTHYQQISAQQLHPPPPPPPRPPSSLLDNQINDDDDEDDDCPSSSRIHSPEDLSMGGKMSRKHRKNYKNMTRERRVEANARERTRVHTISAAFDALRKAVPSYSYNQKLSKLAILRIASSYIMSLARLADLDYTSSSEHIQSPLTFAECVDMCTNTIQTEGRARRRH